MFNNALIEPHSNPVSDQGSCVIVESDPSTLEVTYLRDTASNSDVTLGQMTRWDCRPETPLTSEFSEITIDENATTQPVSPQGSRD